MENREMLNNEELEKVIGGISGYEVTEMRYDIERGEAFRSGSKYYVVYSSGEKLSESDFVDIRCCVYEAVTGKYRNIGMCRETVGFLLTCEYLGKDAIRESDIVDGPHIER